MSKSKKYLFGEGGGIVRSKVLNTCHQNYPIAMLKRRVVHYSVMHGQKHSQGDECCSYSPGVRKGRYSPYPLYIIVRVSN